ncbi:hypothetical protein GCM10007112_03900 [Vulcanisaeta souniana JCM 11219]|uniref:Uncharacterized protein n=1 Tax=Vulcanisaeta souniana JCM 11219 TaxID=1293586 RepID=A0A830ECU9_9CREN|nr:hypothetical protein GCM10007112_03900 [Vulcanisaeta souniana JCM 11219]
MWGGSGRGAGLGSEWLGGFVAIIDITEVLTACAVNEPLIAQASALPTGAAALDHPNRGLHPGEPRVLYLGGSSPL